MAGQQVQSLTIHAQKVYASKNIRVDLVFKGQKLRGDQLAWIWAKERPTALHAVPQQPSHRQNGDRAVLPPVGVIVCVCV